MWRSLSLSGRRVSRIAARSEARWVAVQRWKSTVAAISSTTREARWAGRGKGRQLTMADFEEDGEEEGKDVAELDDDNSVQEEENEDDEEEQDGVVNLVEDGAANIENFDMHPRLQAQLEKLGIKTLFPVQVETFSRVSLREDLIVRSRTGSGKTLAFALPLVDRIYKSMDEQRDQRKGSRRPGSHGIRAVVLLPTRELALQVVTEINRVAPGLRCVSVYGGASIERQISEIDRGADIIVGTPGRVCDLLDRGNLDFTKVESFVLDEADEMLKMGFQEEMDKVFDHLPEKESRQTLLFSATVAPEVRRIADSLLNNGQLIDLVGDEAVKIPDTVTLVATPCVERARFDAVAAILQKYVRGDARALVFVPQKSMTIELATSQQIVNCGIRVEALNGDMTQRAREQALKAFRDGEAKCLVATDVAARGLDIPSVEVVVHYSFPQDIDNFIHRTGRTGRAGRSGTNIVLFEHGKDFYYLKKLEAFCGAEFVRRRVPGAEEVLRERADQVCQEILDTPATALVRYQDMALKMLQKKLGAQEDPSKPVVNLLAAALAQLNSQSTAASTFSAVSGVEGVVTFSCDVTKLGVKIPARRISSHDIHKIQSSIEYFLGKILKSEEGAERAFEEEGLMYNRETRTKGLVSGTYVSDDKTQVFCDVKPVVADLLAGKAQDLFLPVSDDQDLPQMIHISAADDRNLRDDRNDSYNRFNGSDRYGRNSRDGRGNSSYGDRRSGGNYSNDRRGSGGSYGSGGRFRENNEYGGRGGRQENFDNRRGGYTRDSRDRNHGSNW